MNTLEATQTRSLSGPRFGPNLLRGAAGFAAVIVLAEIFSRMGLVSPVYLPPFSQSLARTGELVLDPVFLDAVWTTVQVALLGLLVSIAIAIPLGLVLGTSDTAYAATRALIDFLRPIPSMALLPVAILAMGTRTMMNVTMIVFSTIWPILFNTIYGVHSANRVTKDTARSFGMSEPRVVWSVSFPSAAPLAFTGIRLGATIALLVEIALEIVTGGGVDGVGKWLTTVGASYGTAEYLYGGIILLGIVGWVMNMGLTTLGRKLFGWHVSIRSAR